MTLKTQQLTLANGLRVHLIHDADAPRAAALMQLAAGSHHEPERWPGLAHLLEHTIFSGSNGYQGDDRLMAWAQAKGARLNATTLATSTAWFFDAPAAALPEGLARLIDMLAFPLFGQQAIQQETAVIDAEYLMLSTHADTQREAALSLAFSRPAALRRFHVGNRRHFGEEIAPLQQALRQYHRRFFTAAQLTLWLQGPQPLSELAALAERYASVFPTGERPSPATEPLALQPARYFQLQCEDQSRLRLSFPLAKLPHRQQHITLLRQLLIDEAEQSLLTMLREADCCDSLQVSLPYVSDNDAILSIEFDLAAPSLAACARTEAALADWLRQVRQLSETQRQHYLQLARRQFSDLAALDQLRARAFGFAPGDEDAAIAQQSWQAMLAQLTPANMTRLWAAPDVRAETATAQGFTLSVKMLSWPTTAGDDVLPDVAFYPLSAGAALPDLPCTQVVLPHIHPDGSNGILILSPAMPLSARQAHILQASLRTLAGQCAHLGGSLTFTCHQGSWLLQLSGSDRAMIMALAALPARFSPSASQRAQGERLLCAGQQRSRSDIAVRYLIDRLAALLSGQTEAHDEPEAAPLSWRAALYGGNSANRQAFASLLTRFPGEINSPRPAADIPLPTQCDYGFSTAGQDAAVLLFCPLAEQTAACVTAWRLLALFTEPHFFQRLRVEKNIGYVVSSRFHQAAGVAGLLFVVQSPTVSTEEIFAHISAFIDEMESVIASSTADDFAGKCAVLRGTLAIGTDTPERAREHWLRHHACAPPMTEASIALMTPLLLRDYYQRLRQQKKRWWRLSNHR